MVIYFFSVRLLLVLHGHPRHIGQWLPTSKDFLSQIWSITLFSYLNSSERASISPFQCWVLNKGTTGTIFITSLVWHGLWLGIEPGTSRTQSQHSTTRLSRRQLEFLWSRGRWPLWRGWNNEWPRRINKCLMLEQKLYQKIHENQCHKKTKSKSCGVFYSFNYFGLFSGM